MSAELYQDVLCMLHALPCVWLARENVIPAYAGIQSRRDRLNARGHDQDRCECHLCTLSHT